MKKNIETVNNCIALTVTGMGYEFLGCKWLHENHFFVLRIYIDKITGVNVEDCSKVSRQLVAVLSVENMLQDKYRLEVSSPGIDRPLFTFAHYQKYVGCQVNVKLSVPHDGRRHYKGLLLWAVDRELCVVVDRIKYVLPFNSVLKGNLVITKLPKQAEETKVL